MKISMMSCCGWVAEHGIRGLCKLTKELGLEGIDWISLHGASVEEVKRIAGDYGLKSICYTFSADINFPDKKDRQPGIDVIKKGMEDALVLGADKIMLPLGGKDGLTREQSRKNIIEGLKDAVELGKKYNITVTIEHFAMSKIGPFIISSDVNQAVREAPGVKITYDNGNLFTGGEDPVAGFINSKESIVHVHLKDWVIAPENQGLQGLDGRFYKEAFFGEGIIDSRSILREMKKSGYKGYINLEYFGGKYPPEEAMKRGVEYFKPLIG
jgi:sugar phosphate isomerase/epimerase